MTCSVCLCQLILINSVSNEPYKWKLLNCSAIRHKTLNMIDVESQTSTTISGIVTPNRKYLYANSRVQFGSTSVYEQLFSIMK